TARLLEAVRHDARLILVGDPKQLASIEAGAGLGGGVGPAAGGVVLPGAPPPPPSPPAPSARPAGRRPPAGPGARRRAVPRARPPLLRRDRRARRGRPRR